jgi:hypothetical protein
MNSKILHLLLFVIASQLIKPSPFTSLCMGASVSVKFFFYENDSMKGKQSSFILFQKVQYLNNYFTQYYTTDANPDGRGA